MMGRRIASVGLCVALVSAGCASTPQMSFSDCVAVATGAGATAGVVAGAAYAGENDDEEGAAAAIGAGTFVGSALIGLGVCYWLDGRRAEAAAPELEQRAAAPEPPAPPPAEPAPAPPPPPPAAPSACEVPVVLEGVHFDSDRAEVRSDAARVLGDAVDDLQRCPEAHILVEAHTDSQGSEAYNRALSERRARAVVEFLVEHGVGRDRLTAVGHGETRPAADNGTAEGRARNRRVELRPAE